MFQFVYLEWDLMYYYLDVEINKKNNYYMFIGFLFLFNVNVSVFGGYI